ncbi:hypothetical protein WA158_004498 [Blastocystis sp. Blastoise]
MNIFSLEDIKPYEYQLSYEALDALRKSNSRPVIKKKHKSLEEMSLEYGTKMEYLTSNDNSKNKDTKGTVWDDGRDDSKRFMLHDEDDTHEIIEEPSLATTIHTEETIPDNWDDDIDAIAGIYIEDMEEENGDWNMPIILINTKEFIKELPIDEDLSDDEISKEIQEYIDDNYEYIPESLYTNFIVFETSNKYLKESKEYLYLQTGIETYNYSLFYLPDTINDEDATIDIIESIFTPSSFSSVNFMKTLLLYTNQSMSWRSEMSRKIEEETDKQLYIKSTTIDNMMSELLNLRKVKSNKKERINLLKQNISTDKLKETETSVEIHKIEKEIHTLDEVIEENIKRMNLLYSDSTLNLFKEIYSSKSTDIIMNLNIYTSKYRNIRGKEYLKTDSFKDFDHMPLLEQYFMQILFFIPQKKYESNEEFIAIVIMYQDIIKYLWLSDIGRMPL